MESITLYFKQGSSDKVYQASIEEREGGYVVLFSYGRRGSTLASGTKTPAVVSLDTAKGIYTKLISEKQAKGYTVGEAGSAYISADRHQTHINCQLLTPIEKHQVERFIEDPGFWMQEKVDGRRLLIQKKGNLITGINKLGFAVFVPEPIERAARGIHLDFIIDGEAVGDTLYAFDLLSFDGKDQRKEGYAQRMLLLLNVLAAHHQQRILIVTSAFVPKQKRELYEELLLGKREGVVFKRLDQPYKAGRSDSQFKFKFCESASCIVGKINTKRSVRLELLDGEKLVSVGNVTIPANQEIPRVNSVVEVRYLYAFQGGSLYQPVYLGQRDDIPMSDCNLSQLKFKEEAVAA